MSNAHPMRRAFGVASPNFQREFWDLLIRRIELEPKSARRHLFRHLAVVAALSEVDDSFRAELLRRFNPPAWNAALCGQIPGHVLKRASSVLQRRVRI
jgi:hypothetical protein